MITGPAIKRQIRALQSRVPWLAEAKPVVTNLLAKHTGLTVDREFKMLARLGPCKLALDIGANRGQSVIAFQRYARPNRIVAFEPNPRLVDRLAWRHPDADIYYMALGERESMMTLHVPVYHRYTYDGLASLSEAEARGFFTAERFARLDRSKLTVREHAVPVATLDSLNLAPDVVKIDVQGFESQVVLGGIETFRKHRPVTIVEAPSVELIGIFEALHMGCWHWTGARLGPWAGQSKNAVFLTAAHVERIMR